MIDVPENRRFLPRKAPSRKELPGNEPPGKQTPRAIPTEYDNPELDLLVREIIGRVADKWTMLSLEVLEEHGRLRFTRLGELIGGISQKMLTKTLRQMEADGLVQRTVFPVIPPRVEYDLTELGLSLGEAFCGVWHWAERHQEVIKQSRKTFEESSIRAREQFGE